MADENSGHTMADTSDSTATSNSPRVWLITSGFCAIAVRLIRHLLSHGDTVSVCVPTSETHNPTRFGEFIQLKQDSDKHGWTSRLRTIHCDGRDMATCMSAIQETLQLFNKIDILLCCKSEAVVGTVEELSTTEYTRSLVTQQFDTVFFAHVNFIKALLPHLRQRKQGHIVVLSSTAGHIALPSLSLHSAATWALEGYCDSLAYEIAPFNIKVTIVQPQPEVQILTNPITVAPALPAYCEPTSATASVRDMYCRILDRDPETALRPPSSVASSTTSPQESMSQAATILQPDIAPGTIQRRIPSLPPAYIDNMVAETVNALIYISGHENPPTRHIVGHEGAEEVKEKLKTVSSELEDFLEASLGVDIVDSDLQREARMNLRPRSDSTPSQRSASAGPSSA